MLQPDQRSEISWIQLRDTDTAAGALTPSSQSGDLVTAGDSGRCWEIVGSLSRNRGITAVRLLATADCFGSDYLLTVRATVSTVSLMP